MRSNGKINITILIKLEFQALELKAYIDIIPYTLNMIFYLKICDSTISCLLDR